MMRFIVFVIALILSWMAVHFLTGVGLLLGTDMTHSEVRTASEIMATLTAPVIAWHLAYRRTV